MTFTRWMETRSKAVKVLLTLGPLDITWSIYRIIIASERRNNIALLLGIIYLLFFSWNIVWIVDLIFVVLNDRPLDFTSLFN